MQSGEEFFESVKTERRWAITQYLRATNRGDEADALLRFVEKKRIQRIREAHFNTIGEKEQSI